MGGSSLSPTILTAGAHPLAQQGGVSGEQPPRDGAGGLLPNCWAGGQLSVPRDEGPRNKRALCALRICLSVPSVHIWGDPPLLSLVLLGLTWGRGWGVGGKGVFCVALGGPPSAALAWAHRVVSQDSGGFTAAVSLPREAVMLARSLLGPGKPSHSRPARTEGRGQSHASQARGLVNRDAGGCSASVCVAADHGAAAATARAPACLCWACALATLSLGPLTVTRRSRVWGPHLCFRDGNRRTRWPARSPYFPKEGEVAWPPGAAPVPWGCSRHRRQEAGHQCRLAVGLTPPASPHFLSTPRTLSSCLV